MALVTKKYLAEQVRALLSGGDPSVAAKFEFKMVYTFLEAALNKRLKTEYFNVVTPMDDTIPEGLCLATYDNVVVSAYKDRSRAQLPAMPIKLRRGMGVYHISLTDDLDNPFIPLQHGQFCFVKTQNLMNGLLGQVGYELADSYAVFTEDLTARAVPITAVLMRLVVANMDKYTDFDILPIPADMAGDVVQEVYQMLLQTMFPDKKVDSIINEADKVARG